MSGSVLVITHSGRPEAVNAAKDVMGFLRDVELCPVTEDELGDVSDLIMVMVLGGDGTILRAAEITRGMSVPLLGFNLGHVGFLAESERDDIAETVRRVAARDYTVEERTTIAVKALRPGASEPERSWALNEATLEKS